MLHGAVGNTCKVRRICAHYGLIASLGKLVLVYVKAADGHIGSAVIEGAAFHQDEVLMHKAIIGINPIQIAAIQAEVFRAGIPDDVFAGTGGQVIAKITAQVGRTGDDVIVSTVVVAELECNVAEISLGIKEVIVDIHDLASIGTLADHYVGYLWCSVGNWGAFHLKVVPMRVFACAIKLAGQAQAQVVTPGRNIYRDRSPGIAVVIHRYPVNPIRAVVILHTIAAIVIGSGKAFCKVIEA